MSGFKVPGQLTLTQQSLDSVEDHKLVQDVLAQEFTAVRSAATESQSFTYFIELEVDINASITHNSSGRGGDDDDAWGLAELSYSSKSFAGKPLIKLPTASGVSVPAGLISAKDTDSSLISTFAVSLSLSMTDQGAMSCTASISGADAVSSATAENLLNAQVVRFMKPSASAPSVGASDDDVLTATLSAAELASDYSAELAALEARYTIANMLAVWTVNVPEIRLNTDSILSQHARAGAKNSAAVFEAGERVVMGTPANYGVSVEDYEGNSVTVIDREQVFAVLKQSN